MKFDCPNCGQRLEIQSIYSGQTITCPQCGTNVVIPSSISDTSTPPDDTAPSDTTDDKMSVTKTLIPVPDGKYEIGETVAQGGMGAILNTKDVNLRRSVAMKVLLEPEKASAEQLLRFVEEAQVTGQLEHPGIVPLYELGLDANGNVFYTMKFVKGKTLNDILDGIKSGDTQTIRDYPLAHLLTIFQKVCDAIAFAHSKRVIHRDLKPENIMVGDYGEVLVMDWGLAKVLPKKTIKLQGSKGTQLQSQKAQKIIDSVRKDSGSEILKTMDGEIMGTPGFMSPEQALGNMEEIDERTDIYSLGAILYNILTLHVPITGDDLDELIKKITSCDIPPPTEYNQKRTGRLKKQSSKGTKAQSVGGEKVRTAGSAVRGRLGESSLPHCPDKLIPDSLSAVAMKALTGEAHRRYQTVKELQKDIDAYQGGFATGAEQASVWRQVRLFVKRHKTVTGLVVSIIVLIVAGSVISTTQWIRAEKSRKIALEEKAVAQKALKDLKGTAPALAAQSRIYFENREVEKALEVISYACELVPENIGYHGFKGDILQTLLKLDEAAEEYDRALKLDPVNKHAKENKELCKKIMKEAKAGKGLGFQAISQLYLALRSQGRFSDAIATLQKVNSNTEGKGVESLLKGLLEATKTKGASFSSDGKGMYILDLSGADISDISSLSGMPLSSLDLRNTKITSLAPLKGMHLTDLNIFNTLVSDLTPLKGMPLVNLNITGTKVTDLTPLTGMSLKELFIDSTRIIDLTPLKGLPLTSLSLYNCRQVVDLAPLKGMLLTKLRFGNTSVSDMTPLTGMPLTSLYFYVTKVTDLTPLKGMPLTSIYFTPKDITSGIEVIREMKTLTQIGTSNPDVNHWPTAEFWKKYDAGEFR
ncbi:MAG: protein kinase [Kiritimatiellae bacterium]|nr:protein kinase [Kiritimatiellia bacterium]MDD5522548.1 protein kinase [Kiritimatiellia bacterium]